MRDARQTHCAAGKSDPAGEKQTWELVTFVRHLPRLTPDKIGYMQSLNPL